MELNYTKDTKMQGGFPHITKKGAITPCGEATPFTFNGRLYRLELSDPSRGLDRSADITALIRDRETGEILSRFAGDCYYHSLYQEDGVVYVLGTKSNPPQFCGSTIMLYESRDLYNWTERELISNPGWLFYNTSLTKSPDGYVLCVEASQPAELVGIPFTVFFAASPDLVNWTWMDYEKGYPKHRYCGGPWMRWSRGYYYLILVTELPCQRYTNYIFRTKDFDTWEVGYYNPILMPDDNDRLISPYNVDLSDELREDIKTGFISSNSDIDMCDWQGKTMITYIVGNQLGFYYLAEAEYDGTVDDFLEAYFK